MAGIVGVWSVVVAPGKDVLVEAPASIHVLNVSLGEEIADENGRSVVKLTHELLKVPEDSDEDEDGDMETTVLCSLTAGRTESTTVDIVLECDTPYKFAVSGKNTVYLSGNYLDPGFDEDPSDSELDYDEEAGYDLRDVSSDVEMHPDDLAELESDASRFEEVDEQPTKGQKRPRDSEEGKAAAESKGAKKAKKQKGESGEPVVVQEGKPAEKIEKKDKKEKKKEKTEEKAESKDEKKATTTPGGVVLKDVKIGTGPMAKKGNTVLMRYKGRLQNGKIFDQNVKGKPFSFHLGRGEVIKGWDEGIMGMQPGGERMLTIPPQMAYGKKGVDGIPGNSTLIFEVKLLEIK